MLTKNSIIVPKYLKIEKVVLNTEIGKLTLNNKRNIDEKLSFVTEAAREPNNS